MTRAEFLMLLEEHCPSHSAKRAVSEGRVEVLGLFATPHPAWLVEVRRRQSQPCYFHVRESRSGRVTVGWYDAMPPWSLWCGDEVVESPINLGDRPTEYAAWRRQAQQHGGHNRDRSHHHHRAQP